MLTSRQLEQRVKGFASHRRIEIMALLKQAPDLSLLEIADKLKMNFKTASAHTHRLAAASLITKSVKSRITKHKLSRRGQIILGFLRNME